MKKRSLTKATIFIGIIVSICPVGNALSHQLINSLTAASAADHFLVTCGEKENHHLYVQIDDLKVIDGRQFNVMVAKDKAIASTTNSDGKASPVIRVEGGSGVYHLYVSQTASGEKAANYQLLFHCEDIDNAHFETSAFIKIDQP